MTINNSKWRYEIGTELYDVYSRGNIFVVHNSQNKIIWKFNLSRNFCERIASKIPLIERILRLETRAVTEIDNNHFIVAKHGAIFFIDIEKRTVNIEHKFRPGMEGPISFCTYLDKCGQKHILYGEYFSNDERDYVRIFERKTEQWNEVFRFEKGTIKHIHQIIYDFYHDRFYIATGDADQESGIWILNNSYSKLSLICGGKQMYRTCFIIPHKDGIEYFTDSPNDQNYLIYYDFKENSIQKKIEIMGPCIYGEYIRIYQENGFIVSTSVEPDPRLSKVNYLLTSSKRGKGVSDWNSHVYIGNNINNLKEIWIGRKDNMPMGLCQFGTVRFRKSRNKVIGNPIALKTKDIISF